MQEGDLVIIYDKISLNKLEEIINPVGTLLWLSAENASVLVQDGYILTIERKKVKKYTGV